MTSLELPCWSNSQYSRRECLELTSIPETSDNNIRESTVLKIFEKMVKVDPSTVEDCHWISDKNSSKRVIINVSKRKDATKIRSFKKNLNNMDLTSIGINNPVYIIDSLCTYYKMLWRKCKSLRTNKLIHSFCVTNRFIRLRSVEKTQTNVITHLSDLEELFPVNKLLSDKI